MSANITSPCDFATVRGCCVARHQSFVVPSYEPVIGAQPEVAQPVTRRLPRPQSFTWQRGLKEPQLPTLRFGDWLAGSPIRALGRLLTVCNFHVGSSACDHSLEPLAADHLTGPR